MIVKKDDFNEMLKVARSYLAAASIVVDSVGYVFFGGGYSSNQSDAVEVYKVDSTGASLYKFSHNADDIYNNANQNDPTSSYIAPLRVNR